MADMLLTHFHPVLDFEGFSIAVIKHHGTAVIVTVADDITAKSTLSLTRFSLYKIEVSSLEFHVLLPYLRFQVFALLEHLRQNGSQINGLHISE